MFFNTVYKTDTYHYLKQCVRPFTDSRYVWQVQRYNAVSKKIITELLKDEKLERIEEVTQVTRVPSIDPKTGEPVTHVEAGTGRLMREMQEVHEAAHHLVKEQRFHYIEVFDTLLHVFDKTNDGTHYPSPFLEATSFKIMEALDMLKVQHDF